MEAISLVVKFIRKKEAKRISFSEISLAIDLILWSKLLWTSEKYDLNTSQSLSSAFSFLRIQKQQQGVYQAKWADDHCQYFIDIKRLIFLLYH